MKTCEVCQVKIPDDFDNLLCYKHYDELAQKERGLGGNIPKNEEDIVLGSNASPDQSQPTKNGIIDPEYQENPEVEEIDLVSRCHGRFKGVGLVIPEPQKKIYHAIKNTFIKFVQDNPQYPKFIWSPKVVDVGCGLGIGTNILSHNADFAWGIDKNEENIRYAKQMFEREKNGVYWSPQITFDVVDIINDPREFMKFNVVVCVELIEHLTDYLPLIKFLKRLANPKSITYISTPNRNAWFGTDRAKKPMNPHHTKEWTAKELIDVLKPHYSHIELLDFELNPINEDSIITPIIARCYL